MSYNTKPTPPQVPGKKKKRVKKRGATGGRVMSEALAKVIYPILILVVFF